GWFEDEEAELLLAASARALADLPEPHTVVEVGSYCGRSTVVLGSAVKTLRPSGRVIAIDPHQGQVGAVGQGLQSGAPTFEKLRANLDGNGLADHVEIVRKCSFEMEWNGPISFLLIDGLHDYANVSRDFLHFEGSVVTGGYVAFHDYAEYYPGVRAFVDELLASGRYKKVQQAKSLVVVRKLAAAPLVSCIMPTRDRREFVPQAIRQFLRQDWPNAELIVVDDGVDRVVDLIPEDPRIRYIAIDERRTVGAKRNLACEAARGEIILHWDDDDWMADWRIRYQVEQLLAAKADLCGLPRIYFHEPAAGKTWEFTSPARDKKWIAGATFCYRKDLWRAGPFEDVDIGEDMRFLWSDRRKKVAPLGDSSFYVARLHPGNTSSKRDSSRAWRPVSDRVLARLLDGGEPQMAPLAQMSPIVAASSAPLVSCIMPTRDRRELALQSIQYFLRQDYPERELVIVDDGAEPLPIPDDERIRYIRLPGPVSLGHKRNLAVEQSRAEIIVHWDDDDWYAADRIRHQIQPLLAGEADVAGLTAEHFYSLRGGTFWSCTPQLHARMFFADVHGRSIAYARRVWGKQARYPDLSQAEDARFLQAALRQGSRLARRPNPDKFVYVRHGANTWQFECGEFLQPTAWKAREVPDFLPEGDLAFYRGLSLA
ncbi:MAG TPA: glycosyltransferase, partial [Thermoanaerobaculia bacterium]|nr:glycosyltransferase [Thermoanaerobaculia bacterium]